MSFPTFKLEAVHKRRPQSGEIVHCG